MTPPTVEPTIEPTFETADEPTTFEQTWESPRGFPGFLSAVNNQPIGLRFMITAFLFFIAGGVMALLMRVQLAVADNTFLGPQTYNQLFTMHGSTMMYLFAVPFLEGLALYLIPLQIGSRDVAYPRLSAFGYWTYLFGGLLFYSSFVVGRIPDAGWFGYVPLSGSRFTGMGTDFWLLGLSLVEVGGITAAAEIVVSILKLRAPGMSLNRMPLLVWAFLTIGIMILFAFTTLLTATVLLELDRAAGTHFFDPENGGSSLLWQHLFWFFGHPEVYIMFLPATGIVSLVVCTFARRPIVGYALIVVAIVVTGFISFGLWVHHMFTTGLPELSLSFFMAASLMIALASGTQVFAWIATLWGSRPMYAPALLYVLGFLFIFVLGGLTGVMVAMVPFDWQVHDSFFIVAHFHYVLIGGVLFPIFAGLYYWLPKFTGRMLNPTLGTWSFWLSFVGFNVTFFPMHIMGFLGMPRRVYTYPEVLELGGYNMVATIGSFVLALGFAAFIVDFFTSLRKAPDAGPNPWNADTLEWSVTSPPPSYAYHTPPLVGSLHPLWSPAPDAVPEVEAVRQALAGRPVGWRATLMSTIADASPQSIQHLPGPSYYPLITTLALLVACVGVLVQYYITAAAGALFAIGGIFGWMWPDERTQRLLRDSPLPSQTGLTVFPVGFKSSVWWGMVSFLTVLATIFSVLFYSYFYIRLYSSEWPQGGIGPFSPWRTLIPYAIVAGCFVPQFWARRASTERKKRHVITAHAATAGAAALSLIGQFLILRHADFSPRTNAYGSIFFVLAGLFFMTTLLGLFLSGGVVARAFNEREQRYDAIAVQVQITNLYWRFLAGMAVAAYAVLYLTPLLG